MANIPDILAKGYQLTSEDLDLIEHELVQMPAPRRYEIEGDVLEAIELIITDPEYVGNISLADLDRLSQDEDL